MIPPDDERDEHGERLPDETSERKGLTSMQEFAAIFQGNYERAVEREREAAEHAANCTAETCARCRRSKCTACGSVGHCVAGLCVACDNVRIQRKQRDRALATIPLRFRWAIDGGDDLRKRVKPAGIIGPALAWAKGLGIEPPSLVLVGSTGSGKTSLAVALFGAWSELHRHPYALFASAMSMAMAPAAHPLGQGLAPLLEHAYDAPLLVLDDVGAEPARLSEVIQGVMHKRYDADLPTWITTGLSEPEIAKRYDGGVARRMFEEAKLVKLGEDAGGGR